MATRRLLDPGRLDAYDERIVGLLERWAAAPPEATPGGAASPTPLTNAEASRVVRLNDFTDGARQVVEAAQRSADRRRHVTTDVVHILAELLVLDGVQGALAAAGADAARALDVAQTELEGLARGDRPSFCGRAMLALLAELRIEAAGSPITVRQLLRACVRPAPAATLDELDHGLAHDRTHSPLSRVIAAGRLDLILSTS